MTYLINKVVGRTLHLLWPSREVANVEERVALKQAKEQIIRFLSQTLFSVTNTILLPQNHIW